MYDPRFVFVVVVVVVVVVVGCCCCERAMHTYANHMQKISIETRINKDKTQDKKEHTLKKTRNGTCRGNPSELSEMILKRYFYEHHYS